MDYEWAVVVPIFNGAEYLDSCFNSIRRQQVFASTQVILVDDGSEDRTFEIAEAYAKNYSNVTVIRQEHQGLSAALNAGLAHVRAESVCFLEVDDRLSQGSLARMTKAFKASGADIVIGQYTLRDPRGQITVRRKRLGREVVVDGVAESGEVFDGLSLAGIGFNVNFWCQCELQFAHDNDLSWQLVLADALIRARRIHLLNKVIYEKNVRPDADALTRRQLAEPAYLAQQLQVLDELGQLAKEAPLSLQLPIKRNIVSICNKYLNNLHKVPASDSLDLFSRFQQVLCTIPEDEILTLATNSRLRLLHYALRYNDPVLFSNFGVLDNVTLRIREGKLYFPQLRDDADPRYFEVLVTQAFLERVELTEDALELEGFLRIPQLRLLEADSNAWELTLVSPTSRVTVPVTRQPRTDLLSQFPEGSTHCGWSAKVALSELQPGLYRPKIQVAGFDIHIRSQLPFHRYKGTFVRGKKGILVGNSSGQSPYIRVQQRSGVMSKLAFCAHRVMGEVRKIIYLDHRFPRLKRGWKERLLYWISYPVLHGRGIWLIGERYDTAQDNSYHLFKYIRNNHPDLPVFYVIDRNSVDYDKVSRYGHVIHHGSLRHKLYLLHAQCAVNSYDVDAYLSPREYGKSEFLVLFGDLLRYKRVFLGHGVSFNDVSKALIRNRTSFDLITATTLPEANYMKSQLNYDKQVAITGMARYDALVPISDTAPKVILVMPTWRRNLVVPSYMKQSAYLIKTAERNFLESDYYAFYQELLSDTRLLSILDEFDVELRFYPHYEMQRYLGHFSSSHPRVKILGLGQEDVQSLLIQCSMLITDYSSVFFDVAYMNKPIIYAHFDYDHFYNTQYKPGYFDYEQDGFGPVCSTVAEVVAAIDRYAKAGFANDERYTRRIETTFKHRDRENCKRIFEAISQLSAAR